MMHKKKSVFGMALGELYHVSEPLFIGSYVLTFVQGMTRVLPIITLQLFLDNLGGIREKETQRMVALYLLGYIGSRILSHVISTVTNYLYEYYDLAAAHGMTKRVNGKVSQLPGISFEDTAELERMNKAYRGTSAIRSYVDTILMIVLLYVPEFLVLIFYLYRANRFLPLTLSLIAVPVLLVSKIQEKESAMQENKVADTQRKIDAFEDFLTGVQHVIETQAYGYQGLLMRKIRTLLSEKAAVENGYQKKKCNLENLKKCILLAGHITIFLVLCLCAAHGIISVGVLAALLTSLDELFLMMEEVLADISQGVTEMMEKVRNYFALQKEQVREGGKEIEGELQSIVFDRVSFTYPGRSEKAVKNLSFTIGSKEHIAVVGANGSGKSTLVKLLCGIYEPESGEIRYNGMESKKYSKNDIFNKFTAVFQNYGRYAMNIDQNIMLGACGRSIDWNKIRSLKQRNGLAYCAKIDSDVILSREFGGIDLSGGQWQKIAIARGIYRSGDVFLLDEPTSAIDPKEEKSIYDLFGQMIADKTAVIVTHRMGAVSLADKIIVMKDGEIRGIGKHQELLDSCEEYQKLWYSQADLLIENEALH